MDSGVSLGVPAVASSFTQKRAYINTQWKLDDACPIAWHASSHNSPSQDRNVPRSKVAYLRQCYFECLWLGEWHFPLATFPPVFDTLLRVETQDVANSKDARATALDDAQASLEALAGLVRGRGAIAHRYRESIPAALEAASAMPGFSASCSSLAEALSEDPLEAHVMIAALESGPGATVAKEQGLKPLEKAQSTDSQPADDSQLRESSAESSRRPHKLRNEWLHAIERRELALQLLLVLEALRILAGHPALLSDTLTTKTAVSPGQFSKSKRKSSLRNAVQDQSHCSTAPLVVKTEGDILRLIQTNHDEPIERSVVASRPMVKPDSSEDIKSEVTESLASQSGGADGSKRKKRKTNIIRRWTGFPSTFGFNPGLNIGAKSADSEFPWQQRATQPHKAPVLSGSFVDEEEYFADASALARDADKLHKLFEGFADRLSMCIVTAELSKDLLGIDAADASMQHTPAESKQHPPSSLSSMPVYGTAARPREKGDERDEMHYLCSDIVEPRFSRILPRQCAILRARFTTHGASSAMAPMRLKPSGPELGSRTERQHKRAEQHLARVRRESDLTSRRDTADRKALEMEARRSSQKTGLKDALDSEQRLRQSRGSSISADTHRNRREVSVKRRVDFARAASTSSVHLETRPTAASQSAQRQTSSRSIAGYRSISDAATSIEMPCRANKRKIAEPQRFGGMLDNSASKQARHCASALRDDSDTENPFKDGDASNSQTNSLTKRTKLQKVLPTDQHVTETPNSGLQSECKSLLTGRLPSSPRRSLRPGNASSNNVADGGWQRTESYPVTLRDLSALTFSADAMSSREISAAPESSLSSIHVDESRELDCDSSQGQGHQEGKEVEEEEEAEEEDLFSFRRSSSFRALSSAQPRPMHGLKGLRGWSKTMSFGPTSAFDGGLDGLRPLTPVHPSIHETAPAANNIFTDQETSSPVLPSRDRKIVAPKVRPARQVDGAHEPMLSIAHKQLMSVARPSPFARAPSGRNPFAKTPSTGSNDESRSRSSLHTAQPQPATVPSEGANSSANDISLPSLKTGEDVVGSQTKVEEPVRIAELGCL